jgi:hypothetical protein
METPRRTPPRYPPDAEIVRLRAGGWTLEQIARSINASIREVYRWAAGDTRPLAIYASMLAALPTERPTE